MANIIKIKEFDAPELDVYARLPEVQLLRYYEPQPGLFIAESPKVIVRALDAGYEPVSLLMEERHIETEGSKVIQKCGDIPVYTAEFDVLTRLTGFKLTRGMLGVMRRKRLPDIRQTIAEKRRIAVLENVVNPTNVGAIFRSAAALGMEAVLLTAGCSDPLYRRASRVSMGTVFQVPWTMMDAKSCIWPQDAMAILKEEGFKTAAMALKEDTVSIDAPELFKEDKLAVILGTEGDGLADSTIADCDYTVKIPMMHGVDSLNVAAASAVAFWELGKTE